MYIEQLDIKRLLISLDKDELELFGGTERGITFSSDDDKRIFSCLLHLAAEKTGMPLKNKRLTIELLPGIGSIFLIITVDSQWLLTSGHSQLVGMMFPTVSALFDFIEALRKLPGEMLLDSRLYRDKTVYILTLSIPHERLDSVLPLLSGYGKVQALSPRKTASLDEFADILIDHDAVEMLSGEPQTHL